MNGHTWTLAGEEGACRGCVSLHLLLRIGQDQKRRHMSGVDASKSLNLEPQPQGQKHSPLENTHTVDGQPCMA